MKNPTEKQVIGRIGEDIAETFLVKHGFKVLERNFLRKAGEIDVICQKEGKIYFVEVKTISKSGVSRETDDYRPEDNLHPQKIKRMSRAIEIYLDEKNIDPEWEIIGVMIMLNKQTKEAKVTLLKDFAW